MAVYWKGSNGHIYLKGDDGQVRDMGTAWNNDDRYLQDVGADTTMGSFEATRIADPLPGGVLGATTDAAGGGSTVKVDPDAAVKAQLRGELKGKGAEIENIYNSLFGDLDNLVRTRDAELETEYGGQFKKAADTYAAAIPQIETSYAAIGSADSTDNADAKTGAKKGFDETNATIGKNKASDKAKLGQYSTEQRAKFTADRDSAKRNVERADATDDAGALRQMRNDVETNIGAANVTRATLGTDAGARGEVSRLTSDSGRFQEAMNALDSIVKSSMSGAVKEAAVKAVTDSAGLSDEEKKKVQETYGNVYAEQAAL